MSFVTYVTSTGVVDKIFRTEDEADDRITEAAAESPAITLSKTGDVTVPPVIVPGVWKWDSANSEFAEADAVAVTYTDAELAALLKARIKPLVLRFDDGLKAHWAGQKSVAGQHPSVRFSDTTGAQRFNTTDLWGRSWIGIAWREADRLENNHASKMTQENAEKVVAQAEAEIPSTAHIRFWYAYHDADDWASWVNPADNGNRILYSTNADGTGSVFTDPTVTISRNDWTDIITDQFEAAFRDALV